MYYNYEDVSPPRSSEMELSPPPEKLAVASTDGGSDSVLCIARRIAGGLHPLHGLLRHRLPQQCQGRVEKAAEARVSTNAYQCMRV